MKEYIERAVAVQELEVLRQEYEMHDDCDELVARRCRDALSAVPAADVAEVVHARWKRVRSNWYCTGCNKGYRITKGAPMASSFSYCPNCGAKMDGAAE